MGRSREAQSVEKSLIQGNKGAQWKGEGKPDLSLYKTDEGFSLDVFEISSGHWLIISEEVRMSGDTGSDTME